MKFFDFTPPRKGSAKKWVLGVFLLVFSFSCQKENVDVVSKAALLAKDSLVSVTDASGENFLELRTYNYPVINKNIESFSKTLHQLLENREFRVLLKQEILKQFDGDYDVLFSQIATKKLSDGVSVLDKLKQIDSNVTDYIVKIPKLQLSIPVHAYDWDIETIPNLAITPQGIKDENSVVSLKAYNSEGEIVWIDAQKAPEQAVIIVGINERTDLTGKLYTHLKSTPNISSKARSDYSTDYLDRCYSTNPDVLESWWLGDLEMTVSIAGSRNGINTTVSRIPMSIGRICIADQNGAGDYDNGCYMGDYMFFWTPDYGDYLTYVWVEEDGAGSVTITVSVTYSIPNVASASLSAPITIGATDDRAGEYTIYKHESLSTVYGSSSVFSFRLKQ